MVAANPTASNRLDERSRRIPRFFRGLRFILVGYSLLGRSFAAIGYPPLYIGELVLGWGLLNAPIGRGLAKLLSVPTFLILIGFMVLGGILTAFGIPRFGAIFAFRDGAIWGYGLFAIIVAAYCLSRPDIFANSIENYRSFSRFYVVIAPLFVLFGNLMGDIMPNVPWSDVQIREAKASDVMVHLAGIMTFIYLGYSRFTVFRLSCLIAAILFLGSLNRGGFLALVCAGAVVFMLKPKLQHIVGIIGAIILAISIFSFIDFQSDVFARRIAPAQFLSNILSVFGTTDINLSNTREWRLEWWKQIFDYTFNGPYFWTGKGFGINLATDDGFQTDLIAASLRSPHSAHMTFLARGGVPLFLFWIVSQLSWGWSMLRMILRARSRHEQQWENLGIFLLAYWVAMIVNMNFDVYLEGPMGGILFWSIWGYGLAAMWLHRYRPQSIGTIGMVA